MRMLIYRNILFTHNFHKSTTKHAIGLEIMGGRGRGRGRGKATWEKEKLSEISG